MNDYETRCENIDKQLAELLGYTGVHLYCNGKLVGDAPNSSAEVVIPRWTLDDAAAFKLAVDHQIDIEQHLFFVTCASRGDNLEWNVIDYVSLPNKYAAVRIAIVQATINKLKETKP